MLVVQLPAMVIPLMSDICLLLKIFDCRRRMMIL
jgi:hypothetical protein